MGDGVGIPAFGEHGNGHDAADGIAKATGFADGVHHFAQQFLIGDVLGLLNIASAFSDFSTKTFDLVRRHVAEVVVQRIAGFELLAIYQ